MKKKKRRIRIRMIKLEKDFIGEVCETCDMFQACSYKIPDDN